MFNSFDFTVRLLFNNDMNLSTGFHWHHGSVERFEKLDKPFYQLIHVLFKQKKNFLFLFFEDISDIFGCVLVKIRRCES